MASFGYREPQKSLSQAPIEGALSGRIGLVLMEVKTMLRIDSKVKIGEGGKKSNSKNWYFAFLPTKPIYGKKSYCKIGDNLGCWPLIMSQVGPNLPLTVKILLQNWG